MFRAPLLLVFVFVAACGEPAGSARSGVTSSAESQNGPGLTMVACDTLSSFTAPKGALPGALGLGAVTWAVAPDAVLENVELLAPGASLCLHLSLDAERTVDACRAEPRSTEDPWPDGGI